MSIAQVTVQKSAPQNIGIFSFGLSQGADFCALTSAKSKFGKVYFIEDRDIPQITFEMDQFGFRWLKTLEIRFEGIPKF